MELCTRPRRKDQAPQAVAVEAAERHADGCTCGQEPAQWYRAFAPVLRKYTLRSTGDPDAVEDCTHETFVRAVARRHQFRCRGQGVQPWLFTIARNVALDYRKARRREILEAYMPDEADTVPGPEERFVMWEDAGNLRFLIKMLPPQQARCVTLRFFDGCTVAETAAKMQRREIAVRALQHRAVRNLRTLLTGRDSVT